MALVLGLAVLVVLAVLVFLLVVGIVSALAWLMWTIFVALAVAVIGALVISAVFTGGADLTSAPALLGGLALFVLALAIGNSRRRARRAQAVEQDRVSRARRVVDAPPPAREPRAAKLASSALARPLPAADASLADTDHRLGDTLDRLADAADFAGSRIAVARSSCARFLAAADRDPGNGEAEDFAILLRKRVPERIDECLADCRHLTALESRALLEDAVADVEKAGAIADKRRSALVAASQGDSGRRSLLSRRLDDDPFA